jgi:hypothetical protein
LIVNEQEQRDSIGSRLLSRFKLRGRAAEPSQKQEKAVQHQYSHETVSNQKPAVNVDEFVPDERLDASFFGGEEEETTRVEGSNERYCNEAIHCCILETRVSLGIAGKRVTQWLQVMRTLT